jgi:hypothetical protein
MPCIPLPARNIKPKRAPLRVATLLCILAVGLPHPASATPPSPAALARDGYSSIALTRMKTGHLTLQARVNGVSGRFVLDTGAGRSVIEAARYAKFRLAKIDRVTGTAIGAGGDVPLRMSHGNRLQIGAFVDYGFTAYLMPLDGVNSAFRRRGHEHVDGVIGADVLHSGRAVIDYARNVLHLKPRRATAALPSAHQPDTATQ